MIKLIRIAVQLDNLSSIVAMKLSFIVNLINFYITTFFLYLMNKLLANLIKIRSCAILKCFNQFDSFFDGLFHCLLSLAHEKNLPFPSS